MYNFIFLWNNAKFFVKYYISSIKKIFFETKVLAKNVFWVLLVSVFFLLFILV